MRELRDALVALRAHRTHSPSYSMAMMPNWREHPAHRPIEKAVRSYPPYIEAVQFVEHVAATGPVIVLPQDVRMVDADCEHTALLMAEFGALRLPFETCTVIIPRRTTIVESDNIEDRMCCVVFFQQLQAPIEPSKLTRDDWLKLKDRFKDLSAADAISNKSLATIPLQYKVVSLQRVEPQDIWAWAVGDPFAPTTKDWKILVYPDKDENTATHCVVGHRAHEASLLMSAADRNELEDYCAKAIDAAANTLKMVVTLLATRGITLTPVAIDAKLSKASLRRHGVPLYSYHQITVPKGAATIHSSESNGTHASPRLHMRRGHVRILSPSHVTWVRPCLVGYEEKGVVVSDYVVKPYKKLE